MVRIHWCQDGNIFRHKSTVFGKRAHMDLIKQVTLSEETLQGVVKELKDSEPQKYKGYIKKLKQKTTKPIEEDTNL